MSEDPERDEGEEQSPDPQPSESDAADEEEQVDSEADTEPDLSDDQSDADTDSTAADESDPDTDGTDTGSEDSAADTDSDAADEPDTQGDSDANGDSDADDDSDAEDDSGPPEFTVPGMEAEPTPEPEEYEPEYERKPEGDDESDSQITAVDESDVDEGISPSESDDGRELPENQPGVGVDVPQQSLDNGDTGAGNGGDDDDLFGDGPESDQEMPLAAHIEEMMRRLAVVFGVAGIVALTLLGLGEVFAWLPTAVELIDVLWNNAIPGAPEMVDRRPRLYGPLELILTKLKVTGLAGLLIGLPVFVYETYLFMRPGLYRNERRYYLAAVPTSLVLGTIGMAFAHYVIIPAIMEYFTIYTQENVSVAYGLAETFNLILVLMAYMAVIFQIPLFIMLAIMMGLVTRIWLEEKRLLFWGGFATIAFVINPDPTGMTPFIIAATMIVLYEGTLALLRWTGN